VDITIGLAKEVALLDARDRFLESHPACDIAPGHESMQSRKAVLVVVPAHTQHRPLGPRKHGDGADEQIESL
jgi:hypothetical protein